MNGCLSFLGLIRKAGKLEIGSESVEAAAACGKAKLILSASDASENSVRQAKNAADNGNVQHIVLPFTKDELGGIIGRGLPGTIAVTDAGFASALAEKLAADFPGRYEEAAEKTAALAEKQAGVTANRPRKRRL